MPDGKGGATCADVAVQHRPRTYHNNAVLLPSGEVLVGGHAPIPNGYSYVHDNPETPLGETSNNFKDASFEIFRPPYLYWGPRPVIDDVDQPSLAYGKHVDIETHDRVSK